MVSAQTPFAGLTFCCTSVVPEVRDSIVETIKKLGGDHSQDLTRSTTHLIVGNTQTAKYAFIARHRPDVHVLLPDFVAACKEVWLGGEDLTDADTLSWLQQHQQKYRPPTFWGVQACVTGFSLERERKDLQDMIEANGGVFEACLSQKTTHLIAETARGKKYEFAKKWNTQIVALKWVKDSIKRGMMLEPSYYDPVLPEGELGRDAIVPMEDVLAAAVAAASSDHPSRNPTGHAGEGVQPLPNPRRLRTTASIRLGDNGDSLWRDITAVSARKDDDVGAWDEIKTEHPLRRVNTIADVSTDLRKRIPEFRHSISEAAIQQPSKSLFGGRVMVVKGFTSEQASILDSHLVSRGARVFHANKLDDPTTGELQCLKQALQEGKTAGVLLLPHDKAVPSYPDIDYTSLRLSAAVVPIVRTMQVATQWWVERCLHEKRVIPLPRPGTPVERLGYRTSLVPFRKVGDGSVKGWKSLKISSTGFEDMERRHFNMLIALMGATSHETLRIDTDVLVSSPRYYSKTDGGKLKMTGHSVKVDFSLAHRIPVVSADWVWDSIAQGSMNRPWDYCICPDRYNAAAGNDKAGKENMARKALKRSSVGANDSLMHKVDDSLLTSNKSENPDAGLRRKSSWAQSLSFSELRPDAEMAERARTPKRSFEHQPLEEREKPAKVAKKTRMVRKMPASLASAAERLGRDSAPAEANPSTASKGLRNPFLDNEDSEGSESETLARPTTHSGKRKRESVETGRQPLVASSTTFGTLPHAEGGDTPTLSMLDTLAKHSPTLEPADSPLEGSGIISVPLMASELGASLDASFVADAPPLLEASLPGLSRKRARRGPFGRNGSTASMGSSRRVGSLVLSVNTGLASTSADEEPSSAVLPTPHTGDDGGSSSRPAREQPGGAYVPSSASSAGFQGQAKGARTTSAYTTSSRFGEVGGEGVLGQGEFFPTQGISYDDDPVQRRRREELMLKMERGDRR